MKKPKDSTLPAGDAIPAKRDPLAPCGPLACTIDMATLRIMPMAELLALRDVLHTTQDVLSGLCCQPRLNRDDNYAGSLLEGICEWLSGYEQAVVNVAAAARPATAREAKDKNWLLLGFHADMTDNLEDFAVLASTAVQDVASVRFHEEHDRLRGAA